MSNTTFDLNGFIAESKEILLNPKSHFSNLKTTGGLVEPLIKAVIYGVVAGAIAFIWGLLGLGAVSGGLFGGAIGVMALIWYIVAAIVGLFIGAVILLVISSICKGNTDFEANTRVVASAMVMMPVSALLTFTSGISLWLGSIIMLAVNIFTLYLLYHGLVETLKAKAETSRLVLYILTGLLVLFMLLGMGARKRVDRIMNDYDQQDLQEMLDDLREEADDQ
ncbi:MAG: YIP1 family protein [Bacteroidales bacterium]|jgi:hypothetical protein|nr:YIP1 family protein [Bacteroidales bacterium]